MWSGETEEESKQRREGQQSGNVTLAGTAEADVGRFKGYCEPFQGHAGKDSLASTGAGASEGLLCKWNRRPGLPHAQPRG